MADTGPQGNARVLKQTYRYAVADEWIAHRIDEEGVEPPRTWRIEFELRELADAAARRRARRLEELWSSIPGEMVLEAPTDDPDEFLNLLEEWVNERQDQIGLVPNEESDEVLRRRRIAEFDVEMARWIEEHGSARLKLARSRGYKVTSSYAKERGVEELPECWVDTASKARYRERVDPSMRALKVETNFRSWIESMDLGIETRIVWLVEPPSSMAEFFEFANDDPFDSGADFEQQEALMVPYYLGKYSAFLPVDVDQRAPKSDDPYWADPDEEDEE